MDANAPPPTRRAAGAFMCLATVWLTLDAPLYALRFFMDYVGAVLMLLYIIAFPWIAVVCAIALVYAIYAAVRMTLSEHEGRRGVVVLALVAVTIGMTAYLAMWWGSPELRRARVEETPRD